jgi:homoaconitate hydratase
MGATIVEKIARAHMVDGPQRPLRAGDMVSLRPRHILTHDNTSAVITKFRSIGATRIHDPRQPVVVLDHDIQNRSPENVEKYTLIRAFCREHGLDFHPAGTGIGHQIIMDRGYALPGGLVVASDSHANTYGALGALGTPVVRTDAAAIWATGEFWWQVPRTVQVVLEGELRPGVSGKDLILTLCALYDSGEVLNAVVEFAGPGVASLDMAARMTVANMTTEWGALAGWFPVDETTVTYLKERKVRLEAAGHHRITDAQIFAFVASPPGPDADAEYAARITVDLSAVTPFLAGPDTVQKGRPVAEAEPEAIEIHKAYLLSCVNGRLEDLEVAAEVVRGRRIRDGVSFYIAAASHEIQERAEASGAWAHLLAAGATPLPPGCGPCIGLGEGLLNAGEVGISATNRNFKGRMGARDARVYLASPAVVARSALAGRIVDGAVAGGMPGRSIERLEAPGPAEEVVDIVAGFPDQVVGRLVFVPRENLNTDGIYGKEYTYRELTRGDMARVVMANYDPSFAERVQAGDVLVGTRNFGTGSSREQAATALQAKGIALLIAESLSQTYQRNAYNNGFICIECPALVRSVEATLAAEVAAGEATVIPGDTVEVDFRRSVVHWRGEEHPFPPLGRVPQALVAAGGAEAQVRERLGLGAAHGAAAALATTKSD